MRIFLFEFLTIYLCKNSLLKGIKGSGWTITAHTSIPTCTVGRGEDWNTIDQRVLPTIKMAVHLRLTQLLK